ncbi:MAG: 2-oxoacid:ferredoxin oxidoreductase subunit beta [Thermotogae bacterium]|nr:2-oxoacid:ferredoxin oxidoreductase subunit beta [Thermotogota bacterium]
MVEVKITLKDYDYHKPTWCPGCGDYAVLLALKKALVSLQIPPHEVVVVSGIGCSGKISDYVKSYGYHGIHGRVLPTATAVKIANPTLTVIGAGGDGDGYAIGGNHFLHVMRRNPNITYIVMNNMIYGLTKGQTSPTSLPGFKSGTSPYGSVEGNIEPLYIALSMGAPFVARGFAGDPKRLTEIIAEAIKFKGFAFVDIFSPCVTFNRFNTYDWFKQRVKYIDENGPYPTRMEALKAIADTWAQDKLPLGIIYREEGLPTYEELLLKSKDTVPVYDDITSDVWKEKVKQIIQENFV